MYKSGASSSVHIRWRWILLYSSQGEEAHDPKFEGHHQELWEIAYFKNQPKLLTYDKVLSIPHPVGAVAAAVLQSSTLHRISCNRTTLIM